MNDAAVACGEALLDTDTDRVGAVDALGLDEALFLRKGARHPKQWCTSVVDVAGSGRETKLVEVTQGRRDHIVAWHQARVTNGPVEVAIVWSLVWGVVR